MSPVLAIITSVLPGSSSYNPAAGFFFFPLIAVGFLVFFVEVFVRSLDTRPVMSCRKRCRMAVVLFAVLGAFHAAAFVVFAYRVRTLNGGWPRTFQFYDRMQPWTGVFERSEAVLLLVGLAAGILALAAAVAVFAGWRRSAALAAFRVMAALSASAFLGVLLPMLFLSTAAVEWWFD